MAVPFERAPFDYEDSNANIREVCRELDAEASEVIDVTRNEETLEAMRHLRQRRQRMTEGAEDVE
jgi:hypothetical protein